MFYGRQKEYKIESPSIIEDEFNHSRATWTNEGTALISLVIQDRTNINTNDLLLYKATLVGYTDNEEIDKDWRVGEKYRVLSVLPHKLGKVLYLEEITNGRKWNSE